MFQSLKTKGDDKHNMKVHIEDLKEQCHEDFAVLGQFCSEIITLRF